MSIPSSDYAFTKWEKHIQKNTVRICDNKEEEKKKKRKYCDITPNQEGLYDTLVIYEYDSDYEENDYLYEKSSLTIVG